MSKSRIAWLIVVAIALTLVVLAHLFPDKVMRRRLHEIAVEQQNGQGGLTVITLPVVAKTCDNLGGCVVETDGLYKGSATGLTVIFAPGMRASTITDRMATTNIYLAPAGISFVVEGMRGRSMIRLLAAAYEHSAKSTSVPRTITTTAIAFDGNPANIQTQPLKFKIIYPVDKNSPDYFELFVNVDLPNGKVQLSEKDAGYRPALLKAFGAQ